MTDWTAGYVADITYTFGYYHELNPSRARLAFLHQGLVCPDFVTACELGFGQGISANMHAAASTVRWYGNDFNPAQASFAKELGAASGVHPPPEWGDDSFIEFSQRSDLPDFDYIGLHGIWSWISDENRAAIVEFISRKLKVGGVLYLSYNTQPGWAAFAPMRHLMTEHADILGAEGRGIVSRIDGAIDFAQRLLETDPLFSRANPLVESRVQKLRDQNRHYLAHEYFNRDWQPMHFSEVAKWLIPAKLSYACSANYFDHIDAINLTSQQQTFLAEIPDAMLRESVRDFMVNQQFRKDYWVKGARKLTPLERNETLRNQKFILITPHADIALKAHGALGEASLTAEIYNPVINYFTTHEPKTLAELGASLPSNGDISSAQLLQSILMLVGLGHLAAVQESDVIEKACVHTASLNTHLMRKARASGEISYLASPLTGGGILVDRFQQMFLLARSHKAVLPLEWAEFAWEILRAQGQRVTKDGQPLETPEANLAELHSRAEIFGQKLLPMLIQLQIA